MRYTVDQNGLELEGAIELYETLLEWAAGRSDRFVLEIRPSLYDTSELKRLLSFGSVSQRRLDWNPETLLGRLQSAIFGAPDETVELEGSPDEAFVRELVHTSVPSDAIAGDLCPVETIHLFTDDRQIYSVLEYGRDQILELDEEEFEKVEEDLRRAGFGSKHLIELPGTLSGR